MPTNFNKLLQMVGNNCIVFPANFNNLVQMVGNNMALIPNATFLWIVSIRFQILTWELSYRVEFLRIVSIRFQILTWELSSRVEFWVLWRVLELIYNFFSYPLLQIISLMGNWRCKISSFKGLRVYGQEFWEFTI